MTRRHLERDEPQRLPGARATHTTVWTGSKMVIWSGYTGAETNTNTGGVYDPATDTWTATSTVGAPAAATSRTAVWTGSKMIVWGGYAAGEYSNGGGVDDPTTDTWTATSTIGALLPASSTRRCGPVRR